MPEVNTAINMGYEILCIYEVLHWEQNDKQSGPSLFMPYINMFLKIKVQALGYPPNVETLKEKENYIMQYHCNEGVLLNGECIKKTPGFKEHRKIGLEFLLWKIWSKE